MMMNMETRIIEKLNRNSETFVNIEHTVSVMQQKMVSLDKEIVSLRQLLVTDKNRKGNGRKNNERQRIIEGHLFLLPTVLTNELFTAVVPKYVMALWGNIFKKVDLEKYNDHVASVIYFPFFAIMP